MCLPHTGCRGNRMARGLQCHTPEVIGEQKGYAILSGESLDLRAPGVG